MASNANFGKSYAIQFYSVISYKMHMVFRLTLKYSFKFYLLLMKRCLHWGHPSTTLTSKGELEKCQLYFISLCSKLVNEGGQKFSKSCQRSLLMPSRQKCFIV